MKQSLYIALRNRRIKTDIPRFGLRLASTTICFILGLLTCSCNKPEKQQVVAAPAPQQPEMKPAPATPIDAKKVELGGKLWDPQWDVIVEKALPPEMLSSQVPRDVRRFCPRFYQMSEVDKRAYWAYFFQALAGAEAGLNPKSDVRHTEPEIAVRDSVTRRMVRSEGLLQLTYEDQQRYGCDFDWEKDKTLKPTDPAKTILQPKNNLECGVNILDRQIIANHKPIFSSTGYWSTLHTGTVSYRVFAKQMVNPPLACGSAANTRHTQAAQADRHLSASR